MNAEIKKKWVAALRSGKYKQTDGALRNNDGYCCLGVLCDLHRKANKGRWKDLTETDGLHEYLGQREVLPRAVCKWAELSEELWHPYGDSSDIAVQYTNYVTGLSAVNDNGIKFKDIADVIEKQL